MAKMYGRGGQSRYNCPCCDMSRGKSEIKQLEEKQWRAEAHEEMTQEWEPAFFWEGDAPGEDWGYGLTKQIVWEFNFGDTHEEALKSQAYGDALIKYWTTPKPI